MARDLAIKQDGYHLTLSGSLTIEHGHELREALGGIIARGNQVFVSLAGVEDVDLAGLQLLYAARTEALRENKEFAWTEISAACGDNVALAGLSCFLGFPEPSEVSSPE